MDSLFVQWTCVIMNYNLWLQFCFVHPSNICSSLETLPNFLCYPEPLTIIKYCKTRLRSSFSPWLLGFRRDKCEFGKRFVPNMRFGPKMLKKVHNEELTDKHLNKFLEPSYLRVKNPKMTIKVLEQSYGNIICIPVNTELITTSNASSKS